MFATLAGGYPFGPLPGIRDSFAEARARRAAGGMEEETFVGLARAWVTEIVAEQASIGLAMVWDGGARWPGEATTLDLARALLDGSAGPDDLVDAWHWADDGIDAMVKQVLPGPWSAARRLATSGPERRAIRRRLEDRVVECAVALSAATCPVIQLDEPAIASIGTDRSAWRDLEATLGRLAGRLSGIHVSLAITDGSPAPAGHPYLATLPFASFLVDVVTAGPDGWRFIEALPAEVGVVVGAVDRRDPAQDDPEMLVWAATIAAESKDRGHLRVGVTTSGSLAGLQRHHARRKVESLGMAVRLAKTGPLGQVARALQADPATCRIPSLRRLIADHDAALAAVHG